MFNVRDAIELAVKHHQGGHLRQAEQIYLQILEAEPEHADALHLLGVIATQRGQFDYAVQRIECAVARNPGQPAYYGNLGNAYAGLGRSDDAIRNYERALALSPVVKISSSSRHGSWRLLSIVRKTLKRTNLA